MDTRNYELMFVVGADLDEEQLEALVQRIQRYLETAQAQVYSLKSWGLRRLAYTLKGQREGRYYLAQFSAPTQTVNDLDRSVRMIEGVLRHILVQVDKLELPQSVEEPVAPVVETPVAAAPTVEAPEAIPQPEVEAEAPAASDVETEA